MSTGRKSMIGKKKKRAQKESSRENVYFDEDLEPVEVKMVPEDQLVLNEAELKEEFTKTLTSLDPNNPERRTHFNFKQGAFESQPNDKHIAFHIAHEGVIWSKKEKEELEKAEREKEEKENPPPEAEADAEDEDADPDAEKKDGDEDNKDEDAEQKSKAATPDDDAKDGDQPESKTKKKKEVLVKNQFNFSERASQTFNEPQRDRLVQTEPAPKSVFSQNANAAAIRDEYLKNLLKAKQQQLEEEEAKKRKSGFGGGGGGADDAKDPKDTKDSDSKIKHHDEGDALLHSAEMLRALKIMERVAVLNANSESYHAFRYYAPSDMRRGAFVNHLWTFRSPKGEQSAGSSRMVTCLEWNREHLDLFAVGYGSYSFNEQTSGQICIFSLKSTTFPEKRIQCESGVMCMSFHPKFPSLLCCGSYDGSVAVYDIRNRDDSPIYSSEKPQSHHADPVWAITWFHPRSELQHMADLVFYSISSDAALKTWRMSQNELSHEVLMTLQHEAVGAIKSPEKDDVAVGPDEETLLLPALCCCFDFNFQMEHLYLVGTEDGHIMECNKTYNDGPTAFYANAHHMNVYAVKWNPFHDKIFLSCSEDWTIKLWETANVSQTQNKSSGQSPTRPAKTTAVKTTPATPEPIITYDLGCSVNDLAWSPFSATVFGAVTADGRVHIFDLAQNKNAPLVSEAVSKSALTTIAFPVGFPLVIVGDEKGVVYAHKLSPNLYLDPQRHREVLKEVAPDMFTKNEPFRQKQKERLEQKLSVTGNKVFDLAEHFSPKPLKKAQFTKSMRWKSPTAIKK